MSKDKRKTQDGKQPAARIATVPAPAPAAPAAPVHVPRLFRPVDWLTLCITTLVLFIAYYLTEAPNMTLEDSGELATGSFYAGVPHPPGYPVWTMFTYFFANFLPMGSVAWRVGIASAVAASLACGLLAFLVSRGSSMMMEGIAGLNAIDRRWENAICIVCGFVAGTLIGFNGFMWSQAVIVEVYPFSVMSFMGVLLCLMRWIYAPQQRRYLYWAFFLFGICVTNHQTLILAAPGVVVAVFAGDHKLGRHLSFWTGFVYLLVLIAKLDGLIQSLNDNPILLTIFNVIGVGALYLFLWNSIKSKFSTRVFVLSGHFLVNVIVFAIWFASIGKTNPALPEADYVKLLIFLNPILIVLIYLFCLLTGTGEPLGKFNWTSFRREWSPSWIGLICWLVGAGFYFYMPITSMTNPPMNWGYARTYEGFWHALSRGQYESMRPTDAFHDPLRFLSQAQMVLEGVVEQFNWVYMLIALVPFLFFRRMQKRERAWIIGITAIYFSISILLTFLLNSGLDRQSQDLNKVFYASSHILIAMGAGYGLALIAASMATNYQAFRKVTILGGLAALDFALFSLIIASQDLLSNSLDVTAITRNGLLKIFCWLVIAVCFTLGRLDRFQLERPIIKTIAAMAGLASLGATIATLLDNTLNLTGLRDFFHTLAISFNPNQYALPVFAGLILLAMTLIFLAAICLRRNRAPLALSLALFAAMPINTAMCQWFSNEQRNHWFGYWFGHDMFTPPFGIYPEMARNAILFGGTDPGRFAPTYMIFCESFTPAKDKPMDPKFNRRDVYIITQNALADGTYLDYIRAQYFRSSQNALGLDTPFFKEFTTHMLGTVFGEDSSLVRGMANIAYNVLDVPFTKWGAHVEAERRKEGVYPPKEIYTPTPEDSQNCFQNYMDDVQRRSEHDANFPNEPRQIQPGEDIQVENGHVQVSGQVAVMNINGLLCKVIFDHNPTNDFYVEESFPLQWMYPYETPSGVIMKINRNPLTTLTDDIFKKDHEFWSKYSDRLIGNWITYDTTIKEIADFAEKTYLENNFSGFKGDRKFVRDDDAQKAFSKLRSSQAGVYAWRLSPQCPPEYRPKTQAELDALERETDFAFKQSFAFCPYSPEAVFRYVNFLLQFNRLDDALLVAQTCQKLDPNNDSITGLIKNLEDFKKQSADRAKTESQVQQMETEARQSPTNIQNLMNLAGFYLQMQQTNRIVELFDRVLTNQTITANDAGAIAQFDAHIGNMAQLETALQKMAALTPFQPEPWYDLAALKAILGKKTESLQDLRTALDLSAKRRLSNPAAPDLMATSRTDERFDSLRALPEFQKIVPPN